MNKFVWSTLKAAPVALATSLLASQGVLAQAAPTNSSATETLNQVNSYQRQTSQRGSMSQVTNVNQLRDVSPTDWAYEALRSLVDRYGCIAGFPNQTYRGNQALSRYEFAAGLNSCLNQIERLIASSEAVVREDLDTINRLAQEFEAELATIGGRIDNLESRTAFLEDNQFSTTTKLKGEVIFSIQDTFGDGLGENDDPTETTFGDRVRLNFDTSFTGKDRLRTRLETGNIPDLNDTTGFNETRLGFDADDDNDITVSDLFYRFPIGDDLKFFVGTAGLDLDDIFVVTNPMLESSGSGALSRFSRRNPILFRGVDGVGAGGAIELLDDKLIVTGLYLTDDGEDPSEGEGLFNGSFNAGAQIKYAPTDDIQFGVTYVRQFQTAGDVDLTDETGSALASQPFGDDVATSADQVGAHANFTVAEKFVFAFSGAVSFASDVTNDDDALLYTVQGNVSLVDLGKEGAVLSLAAGIPPTVTSNDNPLGEDDSIPVLVEGLYKFPINDNILITPGAFAIFNPDGSDDNDTQIVGVIRTTFKF